MLPEKLLQVRPLFAHALFLQLSSIRFFFRFMYVAAYYYSRTTVKLLLFCIFSFQDFFIRKSLVFLSYMYIGDHDLDFASVAELI